MSVAAVSLPLLASLVDEKHGVFRGHRRDVVGRRGGRHAVNTVTNRHWLSPFDTIPPVVKSWNVIFQLYGNC